MRILWAFIKKEFKQILRDPSSILIAIILPTLLSLIYMYGINLDTVKVNMGLRVNDHSPRVISLEKAFNQNQYISIHMYDNDDAMYDDITNSIIQGGVIIPTNFSENLTNGTTAQVLVVTDGSVTNTSNYVQTYARGVISQWLATSGYRTKQVTLVTPQVRVWFNQEVDSHAFILPGSMAVTLSLVGILLTALVVAREWERGTMEALLSSRLSRLQFILGKYIAYYVLGLGSLFFNMFLCILILGIPFRGSVIIVFLVGSLFLLTCMGIGLLISTLVQSQFLACQISLIAGFLPALLLSGLMFPISSMPVFFRYLTAILPQRYFVTFIESEYLAGTIWQIAAISTLYLSVLCLILFVLIFVNTGERLKK